MDNDFYCEKKKCRKTAWDTPEYLTEDDWAFLIKMIGWLKSNNADKIYEAIFNDRTNAKNFFYRVIGWPEGYSYCGGSGFAYLKVAGFQCIKRSLPELKKSLVRYIKI
jgi:hypothetical protein